MSDQDLLTHLRMRPYSNPSFWMLEAADEIERLRAYTDAYNTLLAERVEVECLRGLAIRAWHSFRTGLTATGGCLDGLTDGDILELVRLSNVEAAKLRATGCSVDEAVDKEIAICRGTK